MSKSLTPYVFRTSAIVSEDAVNGNLRRQAADINRNLSKRYTYCPPIIVPFDGVVDTDTAQLRSIKFDRPTANHPIEIVRVEFFIYSATGATWTLSSTAPGWSSIAVVTAGATVEAYGVSTTPIAVPNGGYVFTIAGSAANTITRGWMVLHCRADRGVQGASPDHAGYSPTFVDAATSTAGSVLDAELTALAAAVTNDATNALDLRCHCFLARGFGADQTWSLPSGAGMTGLAWRAYLVATVADDVDIGGSITGATIVAAGTSTIAEATDAVANKADDPLTQASDFAFQFGWNAGTVELAYAFCWWS